MHYSSRQRIACFKAMEGISVRLSHGCKPPVQVVSLAKVNSLHLPGQCCSYRDAARFCGDLEACNLCRLQNEGAEGEARRTALFKIVQRI